MEEYQLSFFYLYGYHESKYIKEIKLNTNKLLKKYILLNYCLICKQLLIVLII